MNLSLVPLEEWGLPVKDFFISAGPCAAESEKQVLETARGLADSSVSFMRAGIWKPRTQPGSFEGVGEQGLEWLTKVRDETGLLVGTEAATPEHVKACRQYNMDVLWIGARTTSNPFAVQAVADAFQGSDIPVFVKNPISPDVALWIGAVMRLYNAGLRKIGVIHRGFSTSKNILYRNEPNWKLPIELKRQLPDIPLLCDPSHICGKSELLFSIAQEALDLLFDGLMIEVHIKPAEALSDASQQVTPDQFKKLITRLKLKNEISDSIEFQTRIKELRLEVDHIDEHVLELIGKRMEIARKMGDLKLKHNISTFQPHRWKEIVASRMAAGAAQHLSEEFTFQLFQSIHEEAIRQQEKEKDSE